uniref:Guanylate cyclase activator 2B n=1 Tax=Gopherus evgoodei TaxID=1825980 RepID=A0A8C4YLK5_9SAUR
MYLSLWQVGKFSFPLESVKKLKDFMDNSVTGNPYLLNVRSASLCAISDIPKEFLDLCATPDADQIFEELSRCLLPVSHPSEQRGSPCLAVKCDRCELTRHHGWEGSVALSAVGVPLALEEREQPAITLSVVFDFRTHRQIPRAL